MSKRERASNTIGVVLAVNPRRVHPLVSRDDGCGCGMVRCPECEYEYLSLAAAERCAEDDARKPRKNDWLDPDAWD